MGPFLFAARRNRGPWRVTLTPAPREEAIRAAVVAAGPEDGQPREVERVVLHVGADRPECVAVRTLIATSRPSAASRARQTSPIAPAPSRSDTTIGHDERTDAVAGGEPGRLLGDRAGAPIPSHRIGRDAERLRRFLEVQPAKEPQLDNPALPRVQLREAIERIVERHQIRSGLAVRVKDWLHRAPSRAFPGPIDRGVDDKTILIHGLT